MPGFPSGCRRRILSPEQLPVPKPPRQAPTPPGRPGRPSRPASGLPASSGASPKAGPPRAQRRIPAERTRVPDGRKEGALVSLPQRLEQDVNWLITDFADRVPSIAHAIVVSSDGLPMAFSQNLPTDRVDQLAAVTSGLTSLTQGAARIFQGGVVTQVVVEMQHGVLIEMAISDASTLAVLAAADCDLGLVAYEMTLLAEKVRGALTPATR